MIDKIDSMILYELSENCRRSIREIAKKLGMKKDTVAFRIRRLEENKIITSYYSVIDYSKLGFMLFRVYIKFQNTKTALEEEIVDHLCSLKNTLTVYRVDGDWDLAIGFLVRGIEEFHQSYNNFKAAYKSFISKENISIFLEYVHYNPKFLGDKVVKSISTGRGTFVNTDDKDDMLLKEIAQNPKANLTAISKVLSISSMACIYRLRRLEKEKIILAYRALIDFKKLGLDYFKIDIDLADMASLKDIRTYARAHPNVVYQDITINGSDFEFDILLRQEDFLSFMQCLKDLFPIRKYKFYRAIKIYKYKYLP